MPTCDRVSRPARAVSATACRRGTPPFARWSACWLRREKTRMGDFSAEWLALRGPADHRARSAHLARTIGSRLLGLPAVRVVDLASGTGSNLRYLSRLLPPVQHWRIVDRDPDLLARFVKPAMWAILASVH